MSHYYAVNKQTGMLTHTTSNLASLKTRMQELSENEQDFYILQDVDMKYISRIVYVDGECVYNNKEYWSKNAASILEEFNEHEVLDFLGKPVNYNRFITELGSNASRIAAIDGRAGEVTYNIEIGNEMIALFKEECIVTDFKTITPLEIAAKLTDAYSLVMTGSFREAKYIFSQVEPDEFLTEARIQKYMDMLDAADAIEYATDGEYLFTADKSAQEKLEEIPEEIKEYVFTRIYDNLFQAEKKRNAKYFMPAMTEDDKIIFLIRHSKRTDDTSSTGDLTDEGVSMAKTWGGKIAHNYSWTSSDNKEYIVNCEPNNAHYFSTDFTRTKHTAQAIAEARGDTDYADSSYENITLIDNLIAGNRFWDGANTAALKTYAYHPEDLTEEQLESLGVSTVEEAIAKRQSDFEYITNELLKLADKRLNVMITHDYFLYTYLGAALYTDPGATNIEGVCSSMDYLEGAGIFIHSDNTYEIYPIKCNNT